MIFISQVVQEPILDICRRREYVVYLESLIAGLNKSSHGIFPYSSCAARRPCRKPGTPTLNPPLKYLPGFNTKSLPLKF